MFILFTYHFDWFSLYCTADKCEPTAFVFVRNILGDEEGRKFEGTNTMKKTTEPTWNEAFKLVIEDPESTTLVIRIVNGKEFNKKKVIEIGRAHV